MQPLSRSSRRMLLVLLTVVFLLSVPLLIAYSTGYRLDKAFSIVKTGGIYIHSDLPNTSVFFNDEFIEENGILLRNTLVQNLTPNKRYDIRVERSGYYSWFKTLEVHPNLVTEGRVLMLQLDQVWRSIPATTTIQETISGISASTTVPNPEYTALEELFIDERGQFEVDVATTTQIVIRGRQVASTTIIREIELPEYLEEIPVIDFTKKELLRERQRLVAWLEDDNIYAMWVGQEEATPYFFCNGVCRDTIVIDWNDPIIWYTFYPGRDDVVLVQTGNGIFAVELDNRSTPNIQPVYEVQVPGEEFQFRVIDGSDILVWEKDRERFIELEG